MNLGFYTYAADNPLIVTDPTGTEDIVFTKQPTQPTYGKLPDQAMVYKDGTLSGFRGKLLKAWADVKGAIGGHVSEGDVKTFLGKPSNIFKNFSTVSNNPKTQGVAKAGQEYQYTKGSLDNGKLRGFQLSEDATAAHAGVVPQDPSYNHGVDPATGSGELQGEFVHSANRENPNELNYDTLSQGCIVGRGFSVPGGMLGSIQKPTGNAIIYR